MRYLLILTADETEAGSPDAGTSPEGAADDALQRYTVDLIRAGVLLAGERLAAADAACVRLSGDGLPEVVDPLRHESARPLAFWIVQTAGRDEAVEWARRLPLHRGRVEVRAIATSALTQEEPGWKDRTA